MVRRDVIVSRREVAVAFSPRAGRSRASHAATRRSRPPRRRRARRPPAPLAPPRSYESPRQGADIRFSLVSRSTLLFYPNVIPIF